MKSGNAEGREVESACNLLKRVHARNEEDYVHRCVY